MKNTFLTILVIFVLSSITMAQQNQTTNPPKDKKDLPSSNYFYASPFGLFESTFEGAFEHDLKNYNSVMFMGAATMTNGRNQQRSGGSTEIHYRINLLKHPKEKLEPGMRTFTFFAPYLRGEYLEIADNSTSNYLYNGSNYVATGSSTTFIRSFSTGLLLGLRLSSTENRLSFCVYGGGGLKVSDVLGNSKYTDIFRSGYTGVSPKLGMQFGISF